MASAQVIITQPNPTTPPTGNLFTGLTFFLLQRLPQRTSFIDRIQSNGGRIVRQENQADHIIADHYRADCPPGSLSYTFIETALKNAALPDPSAHAAGRSHEAPREAGSANPGKATRTPFTAEDDAVLWRWVERCKLVGGSVRGNEIYKQLGAANSRHPWQAWRDRYVKRLVERPPVGVEVTVAANPPPSPPMAQDAQREIVGVEGGVLRGDREVEEDQRVVEVEEEFPEKELQLLLEQGHDIEDIYPDQEDDAWNAWARAYPEHSAQSWRRFWAEHGQPAFARRKAAQKLDEEREVKTEGPSRVVDETKQNEAEGVRGGQSSQVEADSAVPVPSSSQKRKRTAYVAIPESTYGKKKRRSGNDVTEDGSPVLKPAAERSFPTSEMNREAQEQLEQETLAYNAEVLPADAHAQAEAQAQFDEDVLGIGRKSKKGFELRTSSLPTSDVNHAADEQLRRESIDQEGEDEEDEDMQEEDSVLRTPSIQSQDEVEDDNSDSDSDEVSAENEEENEPPQSQHTEEAIEEEVPETPADQLTEANLASQQAQHKAQLLRGADLPVDDDARDGEQQGEFLRFLQGMSTHVPAVHATRRESQEVGGVGDQLPRQEPPAHGPVDQGDAGELPLSSQRQEGPQLPSQSLRFETQVPYPHLPSQRRTASQQEEEEMFSSQPSMLPEVSYPPLPNFDEPRSSQTAQPPSRSKAGSPDKWSRAEDIALLRGMKREMSASQIIKMYHLDRSESALRNRRKTLRETFIGGRVPPNHEYFAEVEKGLESATRTEREKFEAMASSQASGTRQLHDYQEDDSVVGEEEVDASDHQAAGHEDEIDLFVPPPDGGWSSSPAKAPSSQATPMASQQQQRAPRAPRLSQYSQPKSRDLVEVSSTSSSSSSSSSDDESEAPAPSRPAVAARGKALDTQDILDAETQQPDLGMVLPPGSDSDLDDPDSDLGMPLPPNCDDDDAEELSPNPSNRSPSPAQTNPSSSQRALADTQKLEDHDMHAYIDTMVVRGFQEASVVAALKCTSMRPDLVELVLLDERLGKGLPEGVAGVWSEEEDKMVESGIAGALRELEGKHGWKEVEARLEFLGDWREDEDEE